MAGRDCGFKIKETGDKYQRSEVRDQMKEKVVFYAMRYANFYRLLTTRFVDCELEISKRER
jgi:hypothetical protein